MDAGIVLLLLLLLLLLDNQNQESAWGHDWREDRRMMVDGGWWTVREHGPCTGR